MKNKNAGKVAGNNEPQTPSKTTQVDKKSNRRGRPEGYERPDILVIINDTYRINLSDGMNKTVQKLITRERMEDSKPESEIQYKKGDKYTDWENNGYFGSYINAFAKLYDLMVEDGIKDKGGIVSVKELIEIHKEKMNYLNKMFENDFKDDEVVSKPKYVKKVEEKGKK